MKFHQQLNDKIWDKIEEDNYELKPEVKDKLQEIADAFIEYLEIPEDSILDMVITGSSASYNYNKYSDLDLHIIVDYEKVHEDCPLVNGYLNSLKKQFNDNHDIFIHGVPVELYAEQKDQGTVHNGLYSLQTGWIDKPKKIPPTDNDAAVEAKYNEIKELVDKCDDSEEAAELLEKIYNMRKAGLAEAGEFCTENLTFKKLRNEGCMDKLRQLKKEKIDKQLSLENFSKLKNKLNKSLNERRNKMKKLESMNEEDYNKSIFSKLDKLINEAMGETQNKKVKEDKEFIDEYEVSETRGDWIITKNFNYKFASCVAAISNKYDLKVYLSYYDHELIKDYKGEETYNDIKWDDEVPNLLSVEDALYHIGLPNSFPTKEFKKAVVDINNDIKANYDAYWDTYHERHGLPKPNKNECLNKLINEAIDGDPQTDEGSIIQKGKTIKGFPWTMTKIDEVSVDILGVTLKYNIVKFHVDMPEEEKTKWDNDRIEYKIVDRNVFDQLEKTITDLIHTELGDNVINDSGRNISIPMEGHIN